MSKVLNVFYGADRLPYKDQERQVHYPMVGNSFAGASLVDEIRFYAKDLGTENNVFVGIAKRPDGQRGYQVLTYGYDTELNEPYWTFSVSGWFTEKVGNVFVSLNVYQGGVDIEVDENSGLAIVSGTPIIQATGSVVLSINYAPVMDNGYGAVPTIDVQEALSLVGSKVDTDYLTANYYNKTTIDGKLLLKADLSYVNGFVKTLEVAMDSSTYVITFTCKDGTGATISTQSIDLPLESVVVSGEYDSDTQSIILTLQNGNTITIPVSDLVDGLVDTTTFETVIQGIEDSLDTKANKSETYDRDYIDGKLDLKADKTTTNALQNQINDLNSRLTVVEEAIIGVDTLSFTALSYSAIPSVSDNSYPLIQSGGLDTKEIKGNSFVHTQLLETNNSFTNTDRGITHTFNGNRITLTGTPTSTFSSLAANSNVNVVNGNKYLISLKIISSTLGQAIRFGTLNSNVITQNVSTGSAQSIITCNLSSNSIMGFLGYTANQDIGTIVVEIQLFNLTKDFGAGNEPTTYDQAVSMYENKGIDITNYVAYTQGTLIDSKPVKLISHGYNLFNGELEQGSIDSSTGANISSSSIIRSINYIKVVPNKSYTFERGEYSGTCRLYLYDKEKNYIDYYTFNDGRTITTPNNCGFVKITLGTLTYNEDVCIHLTGSRTGYAPYKAPIEYTITTEVLRSAGSVQDSAVSKKVGSVDLGALDWGYNTSEAGHERFYSTSLSTLIKVIDANTLGNLLCSKYKRATDSDVYSHTEDKIIGTHNGTVQVYDSSYTDAATFKSAMSGVILNYELATPTEQTATLPTDIEIEKGGSLEVVYDNGYTTPADFVFECAVYKPLE